MTSSVEPRSMPALSRRSLLGAALACAAAPLGRTAVAAAPKRIRLGSGAFTYEWVPGWAKLPSGMRFGNTHGCILVDARGRIYMNTDTEHAVIVFGPDGRFLRSWGKDLAGGAHGMTLVKEGKKEVIYLAHHAQHRVVKTTLDGEVLWSMGFPERSGVYKKADEFVPTSVAIAPNGDMFVADGYGKSFVHQFDAARSYVQSFGGPGTADGQMQVPHGLAIDARSGKPLLLVCDRENHRLQLFSLDGAHVRTIGGDLRRPCHVDFRGEHVVVADLAGRITILDKDDKVVTHLGDNPDPMKRANNGVPPEQWADGEFVAPHCARWDAQGNLYVLDWVSAGRLTKLRRVR